MGRAKNDIRVRFAEIIDPQHVLLLHKVEQREAIQVYLERLIDISEERSDLVNILACPGVTQIFKNKDRFPTRIFKKNSY